MNPARILQVPGGSLAEGGPADITILAPDLGDDLGARDAIEVEEHAVRRLDLAGGVAATIVGGRVVYVNDSRVSDVVQAFNSQSRSRSS